MKYMLLIYGDENALSETERQECYEESTKLAHDIHRRGSIWPPTRCSRLSWRPACGCATANDS